MNNSNFEPLKSYSDVEIQLGSTTLKRGFANMVKHGVVMDVTNPTQAGIAEDAGAVAVMVLDQLPADIRGRGGVARMASAEAIKEVMEVISIPVMAKCRIGHTQEAYLLQELGVDMIDESEVLTPANDASHVWKWPFTIPFVNGCRDLGEAIRRIEEGSAMIRTKGEAGTGDVSEAIRHMRLVNKGIRDVVAAKDNPEELLILARDMKVSYESALKVAELGRLPVVNFAAGGIATPADAAMMMRMKCDGVFVGSGIYKSQDPENRATAIVYATTYWNNPDKVLEAQSMVNENLAMPGLGISRMDNEDKIQHRGSNL
ncbi:MAG: pyridoxal 5'-phosphate synthase lyase subunit PdxS [Candidatus Heimdallarchaeota archaeon]|nr:pyridoxal 5'-phosphate synthase lyase subunit PdxS [Candidatus Heimdallarchaeota archaeon]MDH5646093.1 pyridoxal 5'-phosphate synthase lyase subunit PdxS [Candidatus Heimdallarchaeota archaeon]